MLYGLVNATASGDTIVIPALAGYRIRVLGYVLASSAALAVTFKSGSTAISGPMTFAVGSNITTHPSGATEQSELGVVQTNPDEAFIVNLSAIGTVGGHINYKYVKV